jgi:hypothetical protein
VADFLDEKLGEITARLSQLEPLVEEYSRLAAAASALDKIGGAPRAETPATTRGARRVKGRTKASRSPRSTTKAGGSTGVARGRRRAGRVKGTSTRAAEARSFVQAQPGITTPELAAKMGIKQNYLYRVLPGLEQDSVIVKRGRGWHPGRSSEPTNWIEPREEWCTSCRVTHPPGKHVK